MTIVCNGLGEGLMECATSLSGLASGLLVSACVYRASQLALCRLFSKDEMGIAVRDLRVCPNPEYLTLVRFKIYTLTLRDVLLITGGGLLCAFTVSALINKLFLNTIANGALKRVFTISSMFGSLLMGALVMNERSKVIGVPVPKDKTCSIEPNRVFRPVNVICSFLGRAQSFHMWCDLSGKSLGWSLITIPASCP